MKDATRDAIALRRRLSARLRPLALAIGILVSLGLPITYYVLERGAIAPAPLLGISAGLLVLSTITGVFLGLLVYIVPVRVVGGMESRIAGLLADQDSLLGEVTRRGDRLRSAADLTRAVSGSLELNAVLREVITAVMSLRAEITCLVRLVDHAAGGYRLAETGGERPQRLNPVVRFGEGLTHLVAESRRPVLVSDAPTHRHSAGLWAAAPGFSIYYGVPIQSGETLLGVLSVLFPEGAPPTADEREAIELYAGQAAVAIQNARLFEQSERRRCAAEAIAAVGHDLSQALVPEIVSTRIQDAVRELLRMRYAGLYRFDAATGDLIALGFSGDVGPTYGRTVVFPRGTGAIGLAVRDRRPIATPNILTDAQITLDAVARERIQATGYRSVLAVPLVVKDAVVGALAIGDVEGRSFTDEEVQTLQTFADQAALALENARLYSEAMRREREAEELARIARVLGASLEVADVGERIVESVLPLFEGRSSGLYALENDGSFRGVAWGGEARERYTVEQRFPAGDGVIGWVVAHNAPVANADVLADARFTFPEPRRSELAAGGNRAAFFPTRRSRCCRRSPTRLPSPSRTRASINARRPRTPSSRRRRSVSCTARRCARWASSRPASPTTSTTCWR
jgi:GAF domain-containing protein